MISSENFEKLAQLKKLLEQQEQQKAAKSAEPTVIGSPVIIPNVTFKTVKVFRPVNLFEESPDDRYYGRITTSFRISHNRAMRHHGNFRTVMVDGEKICMPSIVGNGFTKS